ncbi:MAG: DUF192 domain-containing protein [Fimbriimonadales bacterium]
MRALVAVLSLLVVLASLGCRSERASARFLPVVADAPEAKTTEHRRFPLDSLAVVEVRVGEAKFRAWLADTPEKHQEGLMWVSPEQLGERAMLFVFPDAEERSFWMKNTPTPLDIAFFSADRKLLNVGRGVPYSLDPVTSDGPAKYVLEVRQGTFQRLGLRKGAELRF